MKLSLLLLGALHQILCAKPNIYQTGKRDKNDSQFVHGVVEKNAIPPQRRAVNEAGTFQQQLQQQQQSGIRANRVAGNNPIQRQNAGRAQFSPNFGGAGTSTAAPKTTLAVAADWPWSGRQAPTEASSPQVLVATVMTTVTKFAVLTSTVTNNMIELITRTETETEMLTRHSTRTVQVVTTSTSRMTLTNTETRTETSTTYSLVPYTITEVETQTRTIENVILTTFTIPASTIHKTHFSTIVQSAQTVTMTEFLQPMIETIATETLIETQTVTTASVQTVTVKVEVPVTVTVVPEPEDGRVFLSPSQFEELFDSDLQADVPLPSATEVIADVAEPIQALEAESELEGYPSDGQEMLTDADQEWPVDGSFSAQELQEDEDLSHYADLNDYPVAQDEQEATFEFVSRLPSGAEILDYENTNLEEQPQVEAAKIAPDRHVQAAMQQWPFMATSQRAGRVY